MKVMSSDTNVMIMRHNVFRSRIIIFSEEVLYKDQNKLVDDKQLYFIELEVPDDDML